MNSTVLHGVDVLGVNLDNLPDWGKLQVRL